MSDLARALREIRAERDHYERRHERLLILLQAGLRDSAEQCDYADGVRFGLELALNILDTQALRQLAGQRP